MLTVRIVIPCFTEQRWDSILRAVRSAQDQTYTAEIVVVVDHNPRLAEQLAERISRDVTVLANRFPRGASGARNTGAFAADTDLVAFLDDDAVADPDWVKHLVAAYVRSPAAVGVGGCVLPLWEFHKPRWFPEEFLWVVGVTPPGRPLCQVRNVWGSNMLVNRSSFMAIGGFCDSFGKLGHVSEPEDTDLCIRMTTEAASEVGWVFTPNAIVRHAIPSERVTWSFFLRRCWSEGAGKGALATRFGRGSKKHLRNETDFIRTVMTKSLAMNLAAAIRGNGDGLGRAAAILLGTASAGAAYAISKARSTARRADFLTQPTSVKSILIATKEVNLTQDADNLTVPMSSSTLNVSHRDPSAG